MVKIIAMFPAWKTNISTVMPMAKLKKMVIVNPKTIVTTGSIITITKTKTAMRIIV